MGQDRATALFWELHSGLPRQGPGTAASTRHHDAPDAQELADQCQREIDIWHACSEFYGYEFCVLRAR